MKDAFFLGLLILLQISILVSIQFLTSYFGERKKGSFQGVIVTTSFSFLIGIVLLIIMMYAPDIISKFNIQTMMVPESGLIFFFLVFVKTRITIRVLKRVKSPDYYDISFFGKKVYRLNVVKKSELAIFILSMPFTLITGAYFLVNIFTG
jgi:hypothetical protein